MAACECQMAPRVTKEKPNLLSPLLLCRPMKRNQPFGTRTKQRLNKSRREVQGKHQRRIPLKGVKKEIFREIPKIKFSFAFQNTHTKAPKKGKNYFINTRSVTFERVLKGRVTQMIASVIGVFSVSDLGILALEVRRPCDEFERLYAITFTGKAQRAVRRKLLR